MEFTGWVANLLYFGGGCFKSPRKTIAAYTTANILYVILYLSLDIYMAALCMFIVTLRSGFSLFLNDKHNLYSVIILTSVLSVFLLLNIESLYDLAILFAAIFIGLSNYYRDHFYKFKIMVCISQLLWMVHSLAFGVYPMLFCCFMTLSTNIGAILYYSDVREKFFRPAIVTREI